MCIASQSDINNFLFQFKFFAQITGQFTFLERYKNMQALAQLGISIEQALNVILGLTYKNYIRGPVTDSDYPDRNIWEFGCVLDGKEIYIKLSDNLSHNFAKCISFHEADFSISYPYQNGGE